MSIFSSSVQIKVNGIVGGFHNGDELEHQILDDNCLLVDFWCVSEPLRPINTYEVDFELMQFCVIYLNNTLNHLPWKLVLPECILEA